MEHPHIFILFVFFFTFSFSLAASDIKTPKNIIRDWNCSVDNVLIGNFPEPIDHYEQRDSKWMKSLNSSTSYKWRDLNKSIGFFVSPFSPGKSNKIVIHLTGSLKHPMSVPYQNMQTYTLAKALQMSPHDHAKDVIPEGPFNCYIRRDIDFMTNLVDSYIRDCKSDISNCLDEGEFWQHFQCFAGTRNPICCYEYFLRGNTTNGSLQRLKAVYGEGVTSELEKCRNPPKATKLEDDCPLGQNITEDERQVRYSMSQNVSCNKFLHSTKHSCSVKHEELLSVTPCFARCAMGMIINIEITPVGIGGNDTIPETVVSVIQSYTDFNQKLFKGSNLYKEPSETEFGYDASEGSKDNNAFRTQVKPLVLIAGGKTGIWLNWLKQTPKCVDAKLGKDLKTPVLQVGTDKSDEPVFEVDFACTNFEGDENDQTGWRYGWFGQDLQNPVLSSVWRPSYVTINSAENSQVTVELPGNLVQCAKQRKAGPMPFLLILVIIFVLVLLILLLALYFY